MDVAGQSEQASSITTQWSLVLAAGGEGSLARTALDALCRIYWYPVLAYVRRRCKNADDALDLTQEFFTFLLEKKSLAFAEPARGRFRSFLFTAVKHFLINQWHKASARKRGGDHGRVPIDAAMADKRMRAEALDHETPERAFERRWALSLLEQVLANLRDEYAQAGKAQQFEALKSYLTTTDAVSTYAETARRLQTSEEAARAAVSRMRKRYRSILRAEITRTVATPDDVEGELLALLRALKP